MSHESQSARRSQRSKAAEIHRVGTNGGKYEYQEQESGKMLVFQQDQNTNDAVEDLNDQKQLRSGGKRGEVAFFSTRHRAYRGVGKYRAQVNA